MATSVSTLNRSIRPRMRSLTRGWLTPNMAAALACVSRRAVISLLSTIMRSERSLRFSDSAASKPRSRNTFPVERRILVAIESPLTATARAHHITETPAAEHQIQMTSPPGTLLEGMEHVYGFRELGHVEHPVFPLRVDPDLRHAR